MTPVMNLQSGVARERLVADITCGVSTYCNRSYVFTISVQFSTARCTYATSFSRYSLIFPVSVLNFDYPRRAVFTRAK